MSLIDKPPEAWEPLLKLARFATRPLERFLRVEAASGILLLVCTAIALALANSPLAAGYARLWAAPVGVRLGPWVFEQTAGWVVNDVLMVVFFFVVGMEIRRELHHGELSDARRAALPAAAAVGGMVVPALLYLGLVGPGPGPAHAGWGVPMATDIAFAVGILALLGRRVPAALRVLLLALAVIDDLGAILVIALFYSSGVKVAGLVLAGAGVLGILLQQALGVRSRLAYGPAAIAVWAGFLGAGIHPTIAGVLVGLLTPVRAWVGREDFAPSEGLIAAIHPWVAYGVMPLFALANAGVSLGGLALQGSAARVSLGVAVGLVVGKPLGILLTTALLLRLRLAALPVGLTVRHLLVLGLVAGVGFTMALFVAQLAFQDAALLGAAKLGVLAGSAAAALLALGLGAALLRPEPTAGEAASADEAEASTVL